MDTVSPETVLDEVPDALSNVETARLRFSAQDTNADAGVGYMCRLDYGDYEMCSDPKEYAGIAEGEYVFEVYALDAAGNWDETAAKHSFTVDRTPPPAPQITFPEEGFSSHNGHVRMGGSAAPGSKVEVFDEGMWDAPLDADIADSDSRLRRRVVNGRCGTFGGRAPFVGGRLRRGEKLLPPLHAADGGRILVGEQGRT